MASQRQIDANRRNALKSTGPRTQEGKARSRKNALRHGFASLTISAGATVHRADEVYAVVTAYERLQQIDIERASLFRMIEEVLEQSSHEGWEKNIQRLAALRRYTACRYMQFKQAVQKME
jgi:hypothetical protein